MSDADIENISLFQSGSIPPTVGDPVAHIRAHVTFAATPLARAMPAENWQRLIAHIIAHVKALRPTSFERITDMQRAGEIAGMFEGYSPTAA